MKAILNYFRTLPDRPMVRPWALAVPVLVLIIACPLLRPLRHTLPGEISRDEVTRLATVQAIVEHGTLDLVEAGTRAGPYGIAWTETDGIRQPPMLAVLLSPAYWLMRQSGTTIESNPAAVAYVLTLLGVTIPVAVAGGLIYRMARFFELRRKWRTLLGFVVVFGTGLISYATVLNAHAPAAVLVLAGCAALIHTAMTARSYWLWAFVTLAGLLLALAATIDPPAIIFLPLIAFVVLAFRWRARYRLLGLCCYALGAAIPLGANVLITGTIADYFLPAEMRGEAPVLPSAPVVTLDQTLFAPEEDPSFGSLVLKDVGNLLSALVGGHGLLSHFPVLVMGVLGIGAVMHRHWSVATKVFATATAGAAVVIIIGCVIWLVDWSDAMFAVRWFIVFTPLLAFWAGAWMRRSHRPATWGLVAALAAFSIAVSLLGATNPFPREGYRGYSALGALRSITGTPSSDKPALAGAR
jgi:hypothetical protein